MIQTRLRIIRMNMSKKLPRVPVGSTKAEEGIVVQIDPLASDIDEHLHSHMLKSCEALANGLHVVIA